MKNWHLKVEHTKGYKIMRLANSAEEKTQRNNKMKKYTTSLLLIVILTGCSSLGVKIQKDFVVDIPLNKAFTYCLQSLVEINYTVKTADRESGMIFAEGGRNRVLHNEAPKINLILVEEGGKTTIGITAFQPGQLIDYGSTAGSVENFKKALMGKVGEGSR